MNDTTLLWLDVETTGLNPSRHALLEVAMRATRADLEPYAEYHAVLAYNGVTDDFIRGMHGPNGLLDECARPDALPFSQAIRGMRDFVDGLPDDEIVPAGSSVRFDRDWLDHISPSILSRCSHRSFDVSSMLIANRLWDGPDAPKKTTDHRAEHCLDDELNIARWLRDVIWTR